MPSPFPGMDPYLEAHWGDVHTSLTLYARDQLVPQLPDGLFARVEEYLALELNDAGEAHGYYPDVQVAERQGRTVQSGLPMPSAMAAAVAEPVIVPLYSEPPTLRSIRIFDRDSGNRVVTAIEFLSPANKIGVAGRGAYRGKQQDFLDADVSLVEIDLIREGGYILAPAELSLPPACRGPYRISVVRGWTKDKAEVYRLSLRERLPAIRIPLRPNDPDAVLDLQPLVDRCYENGGYGRDLDYRSQPAPLLQGDDAAWADALLREKGRR